MSDNAEPDFNLDHNIWQQDWANQFRGNYETFIDPFSIKSMQAELTRLREVNAELVDALQEISRGIRESNHNTPAYRYFARLCDAALAKHTKKGSNT